MTFFGVISALGQLVLVAMGAIVIATAVAILAGMAFPALVEGFVH